MRGAFGARGSGAPAHARRRPRRFGRVVVATCFLVPLITMPFAGVAQERSSSDVEQDLRGAQRRADALSGELGALRSELAQAEEEFAEIAARLADARGRLAAAEGQVALGEEALAEAEEAQRAAESTYRASKRRLAETEEELAIEERVLTDQLVRAFKYGTSGAQRGAMVFEVLQRAEDPNAFAVGMQQLRVVVDEQDSVVQEVFELRDRRAELADGAARDRATATQAAADAEETLRVLEELHEQEASVAEEVATQEAAQQALISSLQANEDETALLLARSAERRDELADELAKARAAEEARARREAAEARRAEEERRAAQERRAEDEQDASVPAPNSGQGRLATPGADGGPAIGGVVCPVRGAVAGRDFSNDWGYPRTGGRYHQGNDIFAARGTAVVAVDDAVISGWDPPSAPTGLGGITVTYRTRDGSEWYNAHLDSIADGIGPGVSVARGDVIGRVGNTGNAFATPPHLHLGRKVGGVWVNPWPTTSPAC